MVVVGAGPPLHPVSDVVHGSLEYCGLGLGCNPCTQACVHVLVVGKGATGAGQRCCKETDHCTQKRDGPAARRPAGCVAGCVTGRPAERVARHVAGRVARHVARHLAGRQVQGFLRSFE